MAVIKLFERSVAVGDILSVNGVTKVWQRPSEFIANGVPSGYTVVGVCFHRDNSLVKILNKTGASLAYKTENTADGTSSREYLKKTGAWTHYRGIMNVARGVAYWSTNGRTPSTQEQIKVNGNDNPVAKSAFETSSYCTLLRQTYDSYESYIANNYGIKYPQSYGCFGLADGKTITYAYNNSAHPGFQHCAAVSYGSSGGGLYAGDWWLPGVKEGVELMRDDVLTKVAASMSLISGSSVPNNSTSRWFAQRYNSTNAWFFHGGYGNLNNNNCTNALMVQAVTNLPDLLANVIEWNMKSVRLFGICLDNYFTTRKNKRYGRDQMEFEANWAALLVRFYRQIRQRTLRIDHNYAFLASHPKWREILATAFDGRMADNLLCDTLKDYVEMELSPRTYNNREGLGSKAAINQVLEDVYEVTNGYTEDARVIKWDISDFFPSAVWDIMQKCFNDIIEKHKDELIAKYDDEFVSMLQWLAMLCVNSSPAKHCELRTPGYLWMEHITEEKSMFTKEDGVGAPIGRLSSQHAMGMYINDIVLWLNDNCGIKTCVFVDDGTMVVPECLHGYALSLMPELRERLASKGLKLNEKKFYDQPYQNGLELLGRHIRPNRLHMNNKTYCSAIKRIRDFNRFVRAELTKKMDSLISSFNSYSGLLKGGNDYKRLIALRDIIKADWWKYITWNKDKLCLNTKPSYSFRNRMDRKYGLRLKGRRIA